MKASIAASVALAAIATAWFGKHKQSAHRRERKLDQRAHEEAVETFESEGGLVVA